MSRLIRHHHDDGDDKLVEAVRELTREVRRINTPDRTEEREREIRALADPPIRLDAVSFTGGIPGYIERFRRTVPDESVTFDRLGAVVACSCGESHEIPLNAHFGADCGRHFIFDGQRVRVAREPVEVAAP